jgi:hypothetical protein
MNKTVLALAALATACGAISISVAVTIPFIKRYRESKASPASANSFVNWLAPYLDIFQAFDIALVERRAKLPRATIFEAALLVAFPVLVVLYFI